MSSIMMPGRRGYVQQVFSIGDIILTCNIGIKVYEDHQFLSTVVCELLSKVYMEVLEIYERKGDKPQVWIRAACGWMLVYDGGELPLVNVIKDRSEAEKSWLNEAAKRRRMASAVAAMLIKSHSLPRAIRLARSILKHAKEFYPEQTQLINITDEMMEDIMIVLDGQVGLTKRQSFEYIKAAAARQSNPRQAVLSISEEIFAIISKRPSLWVIESLNVITTEEQRRMKDAFVMSAAEGNIAKLQHYLAMDQELTSLHSELAYTILHAAADFGQFEILKLIINTGISLDLRDPRRGQTALHFAAFSGRAEVAELLINAGADRQIASYRGVLPFQAAERQGHLDCRDILKFRPPVTTKIQIVDCSIGKITVTWQAPNLSKIYHCSILEYETSIQSAENDEKIVDPLPKITPFNITKTDFTDLFPACEYRLRVRSRTLSGWSDPSEWIYCRTLPFVPDSPEGVEVVKVTTNALFLTWKKPWRDNGSPVDYYELEVIDFVTLHSAPPSLDDAEVQQQQGINTLHLPQIITPKGNSEIIIPGKMSRSPSKRKLSLTSTSSKSSSNLLGNNHNNNPIANGILSRGSSSHRLPTHNSSHSFNENDSDNETAAEQQGGTSKLHRIVKHKNVSYLERYFTGLEPGRLYTVRIRAHNMMGYSQWSVWSGSVCPQEGVIVKHYIPEQRAAHLQWFIPMLRTERSVRSYELQLCRLKGTRTVALNTTNNLEFSSNNKEGDYAQDNPEEEDFFSVSTTITTNFYLLSGLKAGGKYVARVRPCLDPGEIWVPWENALRSECFATPPTIPDPPREVLPFRLPNTAARKKNSFTNALKSMFDEHQHDDEASADISALDDQTADSTADNNTADEGGGNTGDNAMVNSHEMSRMLRPDSITPGTTPGAEDLDVTHDMITITWTTGDANGSNVAGYEVQMAEIKIYSHLDVLHAREAYIGLNDEEGDNILDEFTICSGGNRRFFMPFDATTDNEGSHALPWLDVSNNNKSSSDQKGKFISPQVFRMTGLQPGRAYVFRVRQRNKIGWSNWSNASPRISTYPSVPPAAPVLLSIGESYAAIGWTEVAFQSTSLTTLESEVQLRTLRSGDLDEDHDNEPEYDGDWQLMPARLLEKAEIDRFIAYSRNDKKQEDEQGAGAIVQGLVAFRWYVARVRVRTVIGWSPWGPHGQPFRTMS